MSNPRLPITGNYNTYVGARYVPIFDGDWNINKEYEPLVIVQYQGASYTSKTYVPIGTEITNTVYWTLTGNYNAQVQAYREEVFTFNDRINANAQGISDEVTARENAVSGEQLARQNADAALTNSVNGLNNRLTLLDHKKYIFIGDSYAHQNGGWLNQCVAALGLTQDDYIDASESGSSFQGIGGSKFKTLLENCVVDDVNSITDIIVCGGYNDARQDVTGHSVNGCANEIVAFCTYAKNRFPNAVVRVGFIGWDSGIESADNLTRALCFEYSFVYKNVCQYGGFYLNGVEYASLNASYFNADTIHPDATGGYVIGSAIANAIKTGAVTVGFDRKDSYLTNNLSSEHSGYFIEELDNGSVQYAFDNCRMDFETPVNINGMTQDVGYVYTVRYLRAKNGNPIYLPMLCEMKSGANYTYHSVIGELYDGNKLKVTGLPATSNVDRLVFRGCGNYRLM